MYIYIYIYIYIYRERERERDRERARERKLLDKGYFGHDVAYSDSKDLAKRTISDNILKIKAYEIARYCKYDGYQRALAGMIYKFFDKKKRIRNECK